MIILKAMARTVRALMSKYYLYRDFKRETKKIKNARRQAILNKYVLTPEQKKK